MRQIILDTETTGLNPEQGHRIIEIGCVELINRKLTGKHYHQYINPERAIDEGALAVHGISNEFLADKPIFSQIAAEFMAFVDGAELVIHNAPFDVSFLNHELNLLKPAKKPIQTNCRIVDSLVLARQLHVGQRNSLDALCKRYFIDNSQRELHGALLDAHLLAQVYLAMTGGQATLFGNTDETETKTNEQMKEEIIKPITVPRNLCVITATAEELAAHEQITSAMKAKGKCLWLDETPKQ